MLYPTLVAVGVFALFVWTAMVAHAARPRTVKETREGGKGGNG